MSCNCKNVVENFVGGDIPLMTNFMSGATMEKICHSFIGTKYSNSADPLSSFGKDILNLLTLGAHPSPVESITEYCIYNNTQLVHADEYQIDGSLNIYGELVIIGTDILTTNSQTLGCQSC